MNISDLSRKQCTLVHAESRDSSLSSSIYSKLPRQVALGTMHGKEAALSPSFADIDVHLAVPRDLNTDSFGTFTSEVKRAGTILDAARAKAKAAAALSGLPIGIASEGSYSPHPFIPLGRELILWLDIRSGVEIVDMIIDESPNFAHIDVEDVNEADKFLNAIEYPQYALIVSVVGTDVVTAKGIRDAAALSEAVRTAVTQSPCSLARIQTDMRAHMNPRRMSVIAKLGKRFVKRLMTACPQCDHPGWGWVGTAAGLCCSECNSQTQLPSHDVMGCAACGNEQLARIIHEGLADMVQTVEMT